MNWLPRTSVRGTQISFAGNVNINTTATIKIIMEARSTAFALRSLGRLADGLSDRIPHTAPVATRKTNNIIRHVGNWSMIDQSQPKNPKRLD
jgi:hypothetical protein